MMRVDELVATIGVLERRELEIWIREELVLPDRQAEGLVFSDMQVARVRLLCTLRYELEIETDSLPVVMSLLDQLYETRRKLLSLTAAVAAQDETVRRTILRGIDPSLATISGETAG